MVKGHIAQPCRKRSYQHGLLMTAGRIGGRVAETDRPDRRRAAKAMRSPAHALSGSKLETALPAAASSIAPEILPPASISISP